MKTLTTPRQGLKLDPNDLRVFWARKNRYDRNLSLRTPITAGLILVIYAVVAFGGVFDAGCCHDHIAHLAGTAAVNEHVHSKNWLAVHSLTHAASVAEQSSLASPC